MLAYINTLWTLYWLFLINLTWDYVPVLSNNFKMLPVPSTVVWWKVSMTMYPTLLIELFRATDNIQKWMTKIKPEPPDWSLLVSSRLGNIALIISLLFYIIILLWSHCVCVFSFLFYFLINLVLYWDLGILGIIMGWNTTIDSWALLAVMYGLVVVNIKVSKRYQHPVIHFNFVDVPGNWLDDMCDQLTWN